MTGAVVEVWLARPAPPGPGDLERLSDAERERFAGFARPADAARFLTGRLLAGAAVCALAGSAAGTVRFAADCPRCGGPHGKPRPVDFPGVQVSIAHSAGIVAVATARGVPVGIDVERIRPVPDEVAEQALSAPEWRVLTALARSRRASAFFTYWSRKEAVLKASGAGLAIPPRELTVSGPDARARLLAGPPGLTAGLADLSVRRGYRATVAVLSADVPTVIRRAAEDDARTWASPATPP